MRSPGTSRDAGGIIAECQGVEAVDDQAERGVRGLLDDAPGVAPKPDVAPPGERLEADAQAAAMRALRHLGEVGGGAGVIVDRIGLGVAADQHHLGAQLLHDVELAFRAVHVAGTLRLRHRLEVAERLVEVDLDAEILGQCADIGGRALEAEQVGLHDLHAIESHQRRRLQLVGERAAQGDGGDGFAQHGQASVPNGSSQERQGSVNHRGPCSVM